MPKTHKIGNAHFVQYLNFPVEWKHHLWTTGWTQEIEEPFRTANPLIFRLPFHKALAFGKWTGQAKDEEEALNRALERRDVTNDDFVEEKGWTPAPEQTGEAGGEYIDPRLSYVGGDGVVYYWQGNDWVASNKGTISTR
jgi:hypothetical protein